MSFTLRMMLPLLALASTASAQLLINVQLDKGRNNFVAHEAIMARITVENRAGKDLVMGGPNGQSWLQINIKRPDGTILPSKNGEPKADPTMLKEGATMTRSINLTNFYPVDEPGDYLVSCAVYFPELSKWLGAGNTSYLKVNSAKSAFWERTIGLPRTHAQAGRYRRYKLFTNKNNSLTATGSTDQRLLYVGITDEETEQNVTTYAVAPILMYRDPQPTTDKEGNLCVLFMAAPQVFQYVVINPDGAIMEQKQYRPTDIVPQLMQSKDGFVSVKGGNLIDRIGEAEAASQPQNQIRGMGERPVSGSR